MGSSSFETKSLHSRNSHVDHSISIHGPPKLNMSNLIDSNVDLFMYLIEGIRFGTRKDRRMNWALDCLAWSSTAMNAQCCHVS